MLRLELIYKKALAALASTAFAIALLSLNTACFWVLYQPKEPEILKSYKKSFKEN